MKLYFDNANNMFSLTPSQNSECIFESDDKSERIGWKKGMNPIIRKEVFGIEICTNFYPQAKHPKYLAVSISINGVKLLPLSLAFRKSGTRYRFAKHEISFIQYGPGNHQGKEPVTILLREDEMLWEKALKEVCDICNNYEEWIIKETTLLIAKLKEHSKTDFNSISTLLSIVREYEIIAPGIIPIYRTFVDEHCWEAMKDLLDYIENRCGSYHKMDNRDLIAKARRGDILWQYIKDFNLNPE